MHFRLKHIIPVFMTIAAMLTIGCSRPDEKDEGKLIKVPLRISVASPDEQTLQPGSKAGSQMDPENLNPIKSLAVFQYDGEGNLRNEIYRDETGSYDENLFYHDYTQGGTLPGELSVTLDLTLRTGATTICLIANMPKEECDSIRRNCRYLYNFQNFQTEVPYENMKELSETDLGEGHLTTSYMSGYYQGNIQSGETLSVTLGRLISNFNIGIIVSDEHSWNYQQPQEIKLQLENIPMQTFVFPPRVSDYEGLDIPRGTFREEPMQVSSTEYTRCYYYVAAFAALTEDDACRLRISTTINGQNREATVLLGNDEPGTPDRSYNVWRNSNYTFNLRLVPKGNKKSQYKARPGEIIVPL